jgi:predicted dehydrogenase
MVGHTIEFNPAIHDLKRLISGGELGKLTHIHSTRLKGPYRADVSVVWDMIPHDVSIMNYLLSSKPSVVTASASINSEGIADTVHVKLEYPEVGVTGYIYCSWLSHKKVRDVTVVGTNKVAIHDDALKGHLHLFNRVSDAQEHLSKERLLNGYDVANLSHVESSEPLRMQVQHFLGCIGDGSWPQTDGENGLSVVTVLESIDRSVALKTPVNVHYGI